MAFRSLWSPNFDCLIRAGNQGIALGNNSLACWVRFDDFAAGYEVIEINDSGGASFLNSAILANGNQIEYSQRNAAGGQINFLGAATLTANTWYHVALTWDGTTLRGYLNGAPNGTNTGFTGTRNNWADLQVGPTLGYLQDALFYSRALSALEVQQLYARRLPPSTQNLEVWLPCFPGTDRTKDYSGNGRTFANQGTPTDPGSTIPLPPAGWGGGRARLVLPQGTSVAAQGDGRTAFNGSGAPTAAVASTADGRTLFNGSGVQAAAVGKTADGRTVFNGAGTQAATAAVSGSGLTVFNGLGTQTAAAAKTGDGRTLFNGSATPTVAIAAAAQGLTRFNGSAQTGAAGSGLTAFNGSATATVALAAAASGLTRFNGLGSANTGGSGGPSLAVLQTRSVASQRRHSLAFGARRRLR